ncbi:MAG: sugar ABC transporter ATP-binding protein, partial [Fimbriimonadales bacterium]|nr:sugar ABC transporter ATP-binding protein [Fimbriimonadales bacterium]
MSRPPLVRMVSISKRFGGVPALQEVSFEIYPGEVHVLAGENGAGKSTLVKILAGVYSDYEGTIEIEGRQVRPTSPLDAAALGIVAIHQELSLVPSMSVADNLFLGAPLTRAGFVCRRDQRAQARALLHQLGVEVDVDQAVEELPLATQQLIEIAKALRLQARVLIMDEPTSALSTPEVERLFHLIHELKARGCGVVYITHRLEEIERLADRITVLRDGRLVRTAPALEVSTPMLIHWMVGRELEGWWEGESRRLKPARVESTPPRLQVENFTVLSRWREGRPLVDSVALSARAGEIVGIAGLQGSGASELLMGLFGGYGKRAQGTVRLNGKPVAIHSPRQAIANGIALLTNDRKATGLVLSLSVNANITLADLNRLSPFGWRRPRLEREVATYWADRLRLQAPSLDAFVDTLSGGNQQKVA